MIDEVVRYPDAIYPIDFANFVLLPVAQLLRRLLEVGAAARLNDADQLAMPIDRYVPVTILPNGS